MSSVLRMHEYSYIYTRIFSSRRLVLKLHCTHQTKTKRMLRHFAAHTWSVCGDGFSKENILKHAQHTLVTHVMWITCWILVYTIYVYPVILFYLHTITTYIRMWLKFNYCNLTYVKYVSQFNFFVSKTHHTATGYLS